MYFKVYLLVVLVSALSTLSSGKGLHPKLSRQVRAALKRPVGQISEKKCEEYSKIVKNNECTHFNPDKPWDYNALPGEFPHMVILKGTEVEDGKITCVGNLISEKFVLTTAVCIIGLEKKHNGTYWARIGENDLVPKNSQAIRLKVIKSYIHPEYQSPKSHLNDIALAELEKDVQFNEMRRPACLNTENEIVEPVFVSGWGISSEQQFKGPSPTLLKTVLEISKERTKLMDPDNPTLVLTKSKPGKKDTCTGDSGAPVMTNLKNAPCMYKIVGLPSFGGKCVVDQTASTRVSYYIPWIESIVWPEEH